MELVSCFRVSSKIKAAAILLSVVIVGFSPSSLPVPVSRSRPAQCPMHRQSAPSPSPIDHRCCQTGRTTVLQRAILPGHDAIVLALPKLEEKPASPNNFTQLWIDTLSPGIPTSNLPLRI